jgi:integrase/recombinase XerD
LFRATLRRHDLVAEVWHLKEPQKLPPVLSPEEVKRVLTIATTLKARAIPDRTYDCGLRASEVHHCVAQPLPPLVQRLGVPQPKGLGVLAPRINPPHAQKTLQSGLKSAAGLLRE